MKPSSVVIDSFGNISTQGIVTANNVVTDNGSVIVGSGSTGRIPVFDDASKIQASPVSITKRGDIVTPGTVTSSSGSFVVGSGASVANQVPIISNSTTSAIASSPVTISSSGNINTPGFLTTGAGTMVAGGGASVANQVPIISNANTSMITPSQVTITGGNIATSGQLTTGSVTYPKTDGLAGQILTANGAGTPTFQTPASGGNVVGSGSSSINQVAVMTNTTSTAISSAPLVVSPSGNVSTAGSITCSSLTTGPITAGALTVGPVIAGAVIAGPITSGPITTGALTYPTVDGAPGQVLTTNGMGAPTFQDVSGGGNVVGSGVSTVNQVPIITNLSTTAISPSPATIDAFGNLSTTSVAAAIMATNAMTMGAVTYATVDGTPGQVLTTNGMGMTCFQNISGAFAQLAVGYSSNLGNGDHLQFDTQGFSSSDISVDTDTPYTTAQDASSIGRITLNGNKSYLLQATLPSISFSDGNQAFTLTWFDSDQNVQIGVPMTYDQTAPNSFSTATVVAYFSPQTTTRVEARLSAVGSLNFVGNALLFVTRV